MIRVRRSSIAVRVIYAAQPLVKSFAKHTVSAIQSISMNDKTATVYRRSTYAPSAQLKKLSRAENCSIRSTLADGEYLGGAIFRRNWGLEDADVQWARPSAARLNCARGCLSLRGRACQSPHVRRVTFVAPSPVRSYHCLMFGRKDFKGPLTWPAPHDTALCLEFALVHYSLGSSITLTKTISTAFFSISKAVSFIKKTL